VNSSSIVCPRNAHATSIRFSAWRRGCGTASGTRQQYTVATSDYRWTRFHGEIWSWRRRWCHHACIIIINRKKILYDNYVHYNSNGCSWRRQTSPLCRHLANSTKHTRRLRFAHSLYYVKIWRHPQTGSTEAR